ncbi:CHASE2 domain-containing protein [Marinobacter orientalis]|uniref:histidine kinase n=1 Tax=Marinobacter orientalis TaxID=1928859 RepID=A0A7Y0RC57_9GAMM|nr:CHASE2 domain-containing protein [Marinobacter orientalis]NMT63527.1 CHASE2 domain-containing protein [Marinobacter orientalis]TGX48583.1 CHASE2 domain-containing protein [Marinobacter orientalis]
MTRNWFPIKTTPWTIGLPLLIILLLLQATSIPQRLDFWLYDTLITANPAQPSDDVVLVAIDEQSLDSLGRWPWPRINHARLVEKLHQAGARTIVFDILFPEPSPDDPELAAAMRNHGNVILPLHLSPPSRNYLISEQLPAPQLAAAASALGHAHVELDADGLARGIYLLNGLGDQLWPSLALAATGKTLPVKETGDISPYTNLRQHYRAVPMVGGAGAMPSYSYTGVLERPPTPEAFRDKTVFIGATAPGFGDILPTPFSGLHQPMSGVEFHANSYSALVRGELISKVSTSAAIALAILTIVILAVALPRMRPGGSILLCLVCAGVLALVHAFLLFYARLWLPVSHALIIPLLALPVSSALRLAMTNRFLNRQLDELARGPTMTLQQPSRRHPSQLLSHFQALFQPEGWLLAEGDDVISASGLTESDIPTLDKPGEWIHIGGQSWISLTRGGLTYKLGLKLSNDLSREATQRYLRRLPLTAISTPASQPRPRENISARIERVRLATERMSQMQKFIRRSFERMPDGIIVTDELGVIRFANGHIEEWFREPMPSLNGLPLARLLEGHDPRETPPWHETVSETLTLSQSRTVDLSIHNKDFLIHFAPFSLPDSDQSGIIANISDISELREQQRQHREAIDFISHDVRSPLVSQLALIEQLKRNQGQVEPEQLEQLGRLARRSYHLAEEFVQLARAEQLTETRFYECEFLAIVENARDSVSEQATEKGIQLILQGTEDLWLKGNAELLERTVINLLTNAVQYSPPQSSINIQVFQAGHQACLTVSDEGEGIAPDELPHLFDRYRRQKSSELSGNHGAGLGLSFVSVVVEKHRGEIHVQSRPGEGSAFTLKLPVTNSIRSFY